MPKRARARSNRSNRRLTLTIVTRIAKKELWGVRRLTDDSGAEQVDPLRVTGVTTESVAPVAGCGDCYCPSATRCGLDASCVSWRRASGSSESALGSCQRGLSIADSPLS